MRRRTFLAASAAGLATTMIASNALHAEEAKRRVAVIGHTGRGDYGHGLDTVWLKVPGVEIVAVADANAAGLAKAVERLGGSPKGFADYRAMLNQTRAEFVSVCPRHVDQHCDMALAAIEAGVRGIYVEKPFCRTPAEADEILAACEKSGTRIAVAHRNRWHTALLHIDRLIEEGKLGRLLEIRGRGKGDRRGGSEDLWVLGTHVCDLFRRFAGDCVACSAVVLQDGRPIVASDVKEGAEGLGPLAGNEVRARYRMTNGVTAYYDSIANDRTQGAFSLQLIGSEGSVAIRIDQDPVAYFIPGNAYVPPATARDWIPITTAGVGVAEDKPQLVADVQQHVVAVNDLIAACDEERQPLCSASDGAAAVEMICAAFESHRQRGAEVAFPLAERGNPLRSLS